MLLGNESLHNLLPKLWADPNFTGSILLSGPEGVGKYTLAYELSMCTTGIHHGDVYVIDRSDTSSGKTGQVKNADRPGQAFGVDAVREAGVFLTSRPLGSKKVLIVNDAHQLTLVAQHSFLKTLEESLASSLIVLITAFPMRLLPTVRSRLTTFRFSGVHPETIAAWLLKQGFSAQAIETALWVYPAQPGLALRLLANEMKLKALQNFKRHSLDEHLVSLEEYLVHAPLQEILSWLMRKGYDALPKRKISPAWFKNLFVLHSLSGAVALNAPLQLTAALLDFES